MLNVKYRVLSEPAEVWWQGFKSDTFTLQRSGWEIAAEEDIHYGRIRLMLRHRDMNLYAMSDETRWDYHNRDAGRMPVFQVRCVGAHIERTRMVTTERWEESFKAIDAQPQFCDREIKHIDDLGIFATPLVRTQELIVDPEKVGEILAKIAEAQLPEQAAIRERSRLRASREGMSIDAHPRQKFHAQVLSIAA